MFQVKAALLPIILAGLSSLRRADGFQPSSRCFACLGRLVVDVPSYLGPMSTRLSAESIDGAESPTATSAAPVLNGKKVLPYKVLMAGLKGNSGVSGVFALLNKDYKRGYAGWEQCEHIGVSYDIEADLTELAGKHGSEKLPYVRAMSFVVPSEGAMQSIADDWRTESIKAGGKINFDPVTAEMEVPFDEDDMDVMDEDDFDFMEMTAEAMAMAAGGGSSERAEAKGDDVVVSPFEMPEAASVSTTLEEKRTFNKENVDKVLEEIRPYLISDGGNVSVERVDEETRNVYLKLEGACGSCPSSTVTMQMGIERVLKENFENLGEVLQVEDDPANRSADSYYDMVAVEVNRISPAITAMGGSVEIINVDGVNGTVELKFNGAAKVRQGLELAIQDIDFVKEVMFLE